MIRRFGGAPRADVQYTRRPGVYAILPRDGRLLVTYQSEPYPELQLPGGGIDPGEGPIQALHREVFEETGWKIGAVRRVGTFRRFTYMPEYDLWAEKLCMIYLARPVRPHGPPLEAGHQAVWTDPDIAARELCNAGDRHFVSRLWGLA